MKPLTKNTAIKAWLALMLFWVASVSWAAQVAGTVIQLSGPLMAKKADGAVRILSMRSEVESGDTLMTEKNTYAMVKFIDNSEITLKPSTTFKVENFSYDADKPDGDKASFNLVKGGLRSVTGLLGKRNKEKFEMKTPSATIGIRGTTFIAEWVEPSATAIAAREAYLMASTASLDPLAAPVQPLMLAQAPMASPTGFAAGLYVHVLDGMINLNNQGGSMQFNAGQFGFTPNFKTPPVVLPQNPGLQFSPPPTFGTVSGPSGNSGAPAQSNQVDCVVR
ncbi:MULTISPECIES: FecR domain-containing protein [unclassified Duganella]|uniref:FecR family protein n=1 Tax=unclassified Duganella TaxID=2636909 RepID=UPI00088F59A7|nr:MULTISPECIES: FecR family protein [unclassified Duganella]SDF40543.1 FecR family protein [Duganella sp. OV458]SDI86037.1 FecR family protein [Duganella sp. OV510]